MTIFVKAPVEVDMVQWTGTNLVELRRFAPSAGVRSTEAGGLTFWCAASQSDPIIAVGDWIAREWIIDGFYPISEADQAETYATPGTVAGSHDQAELDALDQIRRLAAFIEENVPGEPSQSQGAVDTAIRLLSIHRFGLTSTVDAIRHIVASAHINPTERLEIFEVVTRATQF